MAAKALKTEVDGILSLRALFLQETNMQIRYDACHARGWTDSYLLTLDDVAVGYGSIKGQEIPDRDTVFEFFVVRPYRRRARVLFRELLSASGAGYIECQSNDALLTSLLYEFSHDVSANVVLFDDHVVTDIVVPGAVVRRRRGDDRIFEHRVEPAGDWVVSASDEIVATGGFMLHYNPPFADLYMEVRDDRQRRGFGSFLVQELKRECYLAGRVPAARCAMRNTASRATLIRAGMRVCGFMLMGSVAGAGGR